MQGYRIAMEDHYIIDQFSSIKNHFIVAIMDGEHIE